MKRKLIVADARSISGLLSESDVIQTTITSPPYFDMKDYGVEGQIGFGQSYEGYLQDLTSVFRQVLNHTKEDGTLWIIIDTFKRKGNYYLLPFDIAERLKEIGWYLQNIIIWKKDKTVPWSTGELVQRKFEYVLFFSKNLEYKSYVDRGRVFDKTQLKSWWVKYPERYNPKGKALDEIWEFPIPVQGSWGKEYIRHFCPLPKEMVSTMISLSTDEGDLVFDPFAGTGTVLSQAAYMKRGYLGIELNPDYARLCKSYIQKTRKEGREEYLKHLDDSRQRSFEKSIISLRALKFGRLVLNEVEAFHKKKNELRVFVNTPVFSKEHNKYLVSYVFFGDVEKETTTHFIETICHKPPLSKFGILWRFSFSKVDFEDKPNLYYYSRTNSNQFLRGINLPDKRIALISPICVDINPNDL